MSYGKLNRHTHNCLGVGCYMCDEEEALEECSHENTYRTSYRGEFGYGCSDCGSHRTLDGDWKDEE
jgi:hypothetical protein